MNQHHDYSVRIAWSEEDGCYLAAVPELPGCMADGASVEEALSNLRQIASEWVSVAREEGRNIPSPKTVEDYCREADEFRKELQEHIQRCVKQMVDDVLPMIIEKVKASAKRDVMSFGHVALSSGRSREFLFGRIECGR